ncbi:MAG: 30S ribosomal protein S16 [Planctomycetota bacterium]
MAVKIRLKRIGRKNRPLYRICVFDSRTRRDGVPIEEIGSYDPRARSFADKVKLDRERALHWVSKGAQPSETVASFLRRSGVRKGQPLASAPVAAPVSASATAPARGGAA